VSSLARAPSERIGESRRSITGRSRSPQRLGVRRNPGPLRNRLTAAVLAGTKTATTSLYDGRELSAVGCEMLLDSTDRPLAVLKILRSEVRAFATIDFEVALAEGERYESVEQWRATHEPYSFTSLLQQVTMCAKGSTGPDEDLGGVVSRRRTTGMTVSDSVVYDDMVPRSASGWCRLIPVAARSDNRERDASARAPYGARRMQLTPPRRGPPPIPSRRASGQWMTEIR
jgi:uncharacterized protein YhfF